MCASGMEGADFSCIISCACWCPRAASPARTRISARDCKGRERLCRYLLRPAISRQRLHLMEDGRVQLRLKRPWSDGTTHILLEPLDFLSKLAALVPPPAGPSTALLGGGCSQRKAQAPRRAPPQRHRRTDPPRKRAGVTCEQFVWSQPTRAQPAVVHHPPGALSSLTAAFCPYFEPTRPGIQAQTHHRDRCSGTIEIPQSPASLRGNLSTAVRILQAGGHSRTAWSPHLPAVEKLRVARVEILNRAAVAVPELLQ